jgi:hypothetical protein
MPNEPRTGETWRHKDSRAIVVIDVYLRLEERVFWYRGGHGGPRSKDTLESFLERFERVEAQIPYPAVFRDWGNNDQRAAVASINTGIEVSMNIGADPLCRWVRVVLTEEDACLMAAALLRGAGKPNLSKRVLRSIDRDTAKAVKP